jgi:hypothetical protein
MLKRINGGQISNTGQINEAGIVNEYYKTFNHVTSEFLEELVKVFPKSTQVKAVRQTIMLSIKTTFKHPCNQYMDDMLPFEDRLMDKKDDLLDDLYDHLSILRLINAKKLFLEDKGHPPPFCGVHPQTVEAMWQYLHTLYYIGKTITLMNTGMLTIIIRIVQSLKQEIESGTLSVGDVSGEHILKVFIREAKKENSLSEELQEVVNQVQDIVSGDSEFNLKDMMGDVSNIVPNIIQQVRSSMGI